MTASRYLTYLPEVYRQPAISNNPENSEAFLSHYLNIFEKIFSGIQDTELNGQKGMGELLSPEVIGNLFYPRFSFLFPEDSAFIPPLDANTRQTFSQYIPPLNDNAEKFTRWLTGFVNWLATWVDVAIDQSWDIDKKRRVIASIMPVYRSRGTMAGLQQLLNLSIEQGKQSPIIQKVEIQIPPSLRALTVGPDFILHDRYTEGEPVVGGQRPWLFIVNVFMQANAKADDVQVMMNKIKAICQQGKPEFSYFKLNLYPTVQLNIRATLGKDAILGSASRLVLDEAQESKSKGVYIDVHD